MSDFKIQVLPIDHIESIESADKIELAVVYGYRSVVGKGTVAPGEAVVYIPTGSLVPEAILAAMGLTGRLAGPGGNRVKAAKFKGCLSEGLVYKPDWIKDCKLFDDVTERTGITKYEPPIPQMMAGQVSSILQGKLLSFDVNSWKRFPYIIKDGELICLTEKLHGCVHRDTRVQMAQSKAGATKKICNILIGDSVFGLDIKNNEVVPSKVIGINKGNKEAVWYKITVDGNGGDRGSSCYSVVCTDNHPIYVINSGSYIEAKHLEVGMKTQRIRRTPTLNPIQEQILLGKILGDGTLSLNHNSKAATIEWSHLIDKIDYIHFTIKGLEGICSNNLYYTTSGYGSKMCKAKTKCYSTIYENFKEFYLGGNKQIPESVIECIGPIALAFWYMDDGSLAHSEGQEDRVCFATCAFSLESCLNLKKALWKFNINCVIYGGNSRRRIRLNADDAEKFFLLIAPYVPECMQYKLPKRYRGHLGWLPSGNSYKSWVEEREIIKIEKLQEQYVKWDIQTETNNFFANGILVHNSYMALSCIPNIPEEVSHNGFAINSKGLGAQGLCFKNNEANKNNVYVRTANQLDLQSKFLCGIKSLPFLKEGIPVYLLGEVIGVQDLMYGLSKGQTDFRAFDVAVGFPGTQRYLDVEDFHQFINRCGIRAVPTLFTGPFSHDILQEHTNGNTMVAGIPQIREGVVLRTIPERKDPEVGRVILKSVSDAYHMRKGNTTELN